jgi:integrase/recombinase XerD
MKIKMQKSQTLSLCEAFNLFIRHCQVKNLSSETITSYNNLCKPFLDWYSGNLSDISSDVIDQFTLYLHNKYSNDITVNSYLRNTKAFLYYCMDCEYVSPFKIHIYKADKKVKETYTESELKRLLTKPDKKKCSFSEYKLWAFENYLLGTGNRISSALNIKIGDIDFENGYITLRHTKNRKQQIIPMAESLSNVLKEYLSVRGGTVDDYLFCNDEGGQAQRSGYISMVRRYNARHNVNKYSCHLFRSTYAKMAVLNGIDTFRLQKLMGHADISTTQIYVQMFSEDLKKDYDKYNPLDSLQEKKTSIRMR